jgi:hypothetical protein
VATPIFFEILQSAAPPSSWLNPPVDTLVGRRWGQRAKSQRSTIRGKADASQKVFTQSVTARIHFDSMSWAIHRSNAAETTLDGCSLSRLARLQQSGTLFVKELRMALRWFVDFLHQNARPARIVNRGERASWCAQSRLAFAIGVESLDGVGNNLAHPIGAASIRLIRMAVADYGDGVPLSRRG